MATLAAWYDDERGAAGGDGAGMRRDRGSDDPYRVRAFAGEDDMLWVKSIDNSRVVRESDPRLLETCWKFITVASVVMILVVGLLLPNAYGMLAGYKLHKLQQERTQLLRERAALELEESRLLSPEGLLVGVSGPDGIVRPLAARWPDAQGRFELVLPSSVRGERLRFWEDEVERFVGSGAAPASPVDVTTWPTSLDPDVPRDVATLLVPG